MGIYNISRFDLFSGFSIRGVHMSNRKGNGIELLKKNHLELGKLYQKQIKVNDDQTREIERLKKLSSNYGTVCKDCCTATSKQEELSNQVDDLTYERDLAVYGLVMILVVNIGKVLIWGF